MNEVLMDDDGDTTGADEALAQDLRRRLASQIRQLLGGARRVALLDFPYHRNAGDAAIWAGELAVLGEIGVDIGYVADAGRYHPDRLREAVPEGPVLLHGGGSVGDLWPWPQAMRERVLADFPDREVVQLPQSIHFRDALAQRRFRETVVRHGRYTFLARDRQSLDRAADLSPRAVHLLPDMAFGLGALTRPGSWSTPVVALARDDVESGSGLRITARGVVPVVDWDLGRLGNLRWQLTRTVPRGVRPLTSRPRGWRAVAPVHDRALDAMQRQVLGAGLRLLASASVVVTDRLHAHVLCVLLGIPHVVLDNSYGKVRALHEQWTAESRTTHWSDDPGEALRLAHRLAVGARRDR